MPPDQPPLPTPVPTMMPRLPEPDFGKFGHGISLLGGWFPLTLEVLTVLTLIVAIGLRTSRWRLLWVPISTAIGAIMALCARTYMNSEGLASDPAPVKLWIWVAVFGAAIAVAVLGWSSARWWRRGAALLATALTFLSAVTVLNQWVGYYPTLQRAWGDLTAGPLLDQISAEDLPALRNTIQSTGKVVPVDISSAASGFPHRMEYVYLPPIWFAGPQPPTLAAVMMVGGEFGNATSWIRNGYAVASLDNYTKRHGGAAPIFVFVDSSGSFNNDTECVNGPRGNAADHLTKDVRPYIISQFGGSPDPARWGIVGFSMGGTCAIDLTVTHPELFKTFVDIGGDSGPNAGTKAQTISRLFGGDVAQWAAFDPRTVMANHGPYTGVSGWFDDSQEPPDDKSEALDKISDERPIPNAPVGFGGHDDPNDPWREKGALPQLCAAAMAVNIGCALHVYTGYHTFQFGRQAFPDALPWLAQRLGAT